MRLGDVMNPEGPVRYQYRGCDKWLSDGEFETVGDCGHGCCDHCKCKECGYVTQVEWPD